jgi:hypothetical protein
VLPLILLAAGLAALGAAVLVLRSFGRGWRIGRLLAATPVVSVATAVAIAASGERRYVRIDGRIDSATDFEDEHHRPLVFRRVVIEARTGRDWRIIGDHRKHVPFQVHQGLAAIDVDVDGLDDGLVVIPRLSSGTAHEVPEFMPTDLPGETPVRLRIDQVSSVEQAIVAGVPVVGPEGIARIGPGNGRPLILTTLDAPEAMRILGRGNRTRAALATGLLGGGTVLVAAAAAWAVVGGPR